MAEQAEQDCPVICRSRRKRLISEVLASGSGMDRRRPATSPQKDHVASAAVNCRSGVSSRGHATCSGTAQGSAASQEVKATATTGQFIIVALIATRHGRWYEMLGDSTAAAESLVRKLVDETNHCASMEDALASPAVDAWLLGFAVMRSWKLNASASDAESLAMRSCLSRQHARSSALHFLEHEVVANCRCPEPMPLGCDPHQVDSRELGQRCRHMVRRTKLLLGSVGPADGRPASTSSLPSDALFAQWQLQHGVSDIVHTWPAYYPVSLGLVHGTLRADITAMVPRNMHQCWTPPVLPPRSARRKLLKLPGCVGEHRQFEDVGSAPTALPSTSSLGQKFPAEDLLNAVELGREIKDQSRFKVTAAKALRFFYPQDWKRRVAEFGRSRRRTPGKSLLRSARVRLDVTAMLWHREWSGQRRLFRYVSVDASPQMSMSYEVFVSAERVVLRDHLLGHTLRTLDPASVIPRSLPLATLGQGKTALSDKVAAHVHQTWCDYGPDRASVRTAFADVRQVLTDMGVEFGMANYHDVVDDVIPAVKGRAEPPVQPADRSAHLFPYALQVPGLLHLLDWVIREIVQSLPWWPAWQGKAKRILQYTHGQNHRTILVKRILELVPDVEASDVQRAFKTATGRFAKWRWKTLHRALQDLRRVEPGLFKLASKALSFQKDLAIRDAAAASSLQAACGDSVFWLQARAIAACIRHPMALMGWIQGCECHEEELRQGKCVVCNMKGIRGPGLSKQIKSTMDAMASDRAALVADEWSGVSVLHIKDAITHGIACLKLKTQWVSDLPYLVWQVGSVSVSI